MGNTIKDSFYPPREVTAQAENFLYHNEGFYPKDDVKGAAVLYSFENYYWRETTKGNGGNTMLEDQESLLDCTTSAWPNDSEEKMPFWEVIKTLIRHQVNYDYDKALDKILPIDSSTVTVPDEGKTPSLYTSNGNLPEMFLEKKEGKLLIALKEVPIYVAIVLS